MIETRWQARDVAVERERKNPRLRRISGLDRRNSAGFATRAYFKAEPVSTGVIDSDCAARPLAATLTLFCFGFFPGHKIENCRRKFSRSLIIHVEV